MRDACFIVQPMDQRADFVCEWYIKEALRDKFKIVTPGTEPTTSITADIFAHLKDDDLVVAFLAAPYRVPGMDSHWFWNPNVMLEAGYRLALGQPIIFLREKKVQNDEPFLPFDLFDITVIELVAPEEERDRQKREGIVNQIRRHADLFTKPSGTTADFLRVYAYPAVSMAFGQGRGSIIEASPDVAQFFQYPSGQNMVGLDAREFVKKLTQEIAPSQRAAFTDEQNRLLGMIFQGEKPLATVCIVFGNEDITPGSKVENAYLPLVTRFTTAAGKPTVLEVIYLNVTAIARVGIDGVVRCFLGMKSPEYSPAFA